VAEVVPIGLAGEENQRVDHFLVKRVAIERGGQVHETTRSFDGWSSSERAYRDIQHSRPKCGHGLCYTPKRAQKCQPGRLVGYFSEMLDHLRRVGVGRSFRQRHQSLYGRFGHLSVRPRRVSIEDIDISKCTLHWRVGLGS
jgi:hypothetical protein